MLYVEKLENAVLFTQVHFLKKKQLDFSFLSQVVKSKLKFRLQVVRKLLTMQDVFLNI